MRRFNPVLFAVVMLIAGLCTQVACSRHPLAEQIGDAVSFSLMRGRTSVLWSGTASGQGAMPGSHGGSRPAPRQRVVDRGDSAAREYCTIRCHVSDQAP